MWIPVIPAGGVTLVVRDEPVGAEPCCGSQAGGDGCAEPVAAGQNRRQFGGEPVNRAQVQPTQQASQGLDFVTGAGATRTVQPSVRQGVRRLPALFLVQTGLYC